MIYLKVREAQFNRLVIFKVNLWRSLLFSNGFSTHVREKKKENNNSIQLFFSHLLSCLLPYIHLCNRGKYSLLIASFSLSIRIHL